jgi:poly-D-alanine transfer protein DltD
MKKIVVFHLVPLGAAIVLLFSMSSGINRLLFSDANSVAENHDFQYIPNFQNENEQYEDQFLKPQNDAQTIFILGSSELTNGGEALPFHFISSRFSTQVKGVGHAGNQCFSIYSQLLANENRLENAPILIVLSPGWFFGESAKGTTSSLFLEFNSEKFIGNILNIKNSSPLSPFKEYEAKRVGNFYTEILNSGINLKRLFFEHLASKSKFHKWVYFPIIQGNRFCSILNQKLIGLNNPKDVTACGINRKPLISESVSINWDSLFLASRQEQFDSSTNNSWYIYNDYYNQYVNGETRQITIVEEKNNQELADFQMLIKLLLAKKAHVSFVIIPLNPYCYTNLAEGTPLINLLENELKTNQLPYLNLWNTDTVSFDHGVLTDVMHLSKYGWYQVDKFIVETYHLAK